MKFILFAGATLMIGAGIYGFADYKKTNRDKKFTDMYQDRKEIKSIDPEKKVTPRPVKTENEKQQADKKTQKYLPDNEKMMDTKLPVKDKGLVQKIRKPKKKKISTKIFSRAPIREEILYLDSIPEKKSGKLTVELKDQE